MNTTTKTAAQSPKAIEITLTTCVTTERAEALRFALEGESRLKLYVKLCPHGGCVVVKVGTLAKGATRAKLNETVMELLAKTVQDSLTRRAA